MTTTHQKQRSRSRFAGAAMLAGMLAAGAFGAPAPANAAGTYLALAYQQSYGFNGKLVYRDAHGVGQSGVMDTARINAINDCQKNGGQTGGGQVAGGGAPPHEFAALAAADRAPGGENPPATS